MVKAWFQIVQANLTTKKEVTMSKKEPILYDILRAYKVPHPAYEHWSKTLYECQCTDCGHTISQDLVDIYDDTKNTNVQNAIMSKLSWK